MDTMTRNVEIRSRNRMRLLNALYAWSEGDVGREFPITEVLERSGLETLEELKPLAQFLEDAGFVRFRAGGSLGITHDGVLLMEAAIREPGTAYGDLPSLADALGRSRPVKKKTQDSWAARWLRLLLAGLFDALSDGFSRIAEGLRRR